VVLGAPKPIEAVQRSITMNADGTADTLSRPPSMRSVLSYDLIPNPIFTNKLQQGSSALPTPQSDESPMVLLSPALSTPTLMRCAVGVAPSHGGTGSNSPYVGQNPISPSHSKALPYSRDAEDGQDVSGMYA
jgi:hypothetical protein